MPRDADVTLCPSSAPIGREPGQLEAAAPCAPTSSANDAPSAVTSAMDISLDSVDMKVACASGSKASQGSNDGGSQKNSTPEKDSSKQNDGSNAANNPKARRGKTRRPPRRARRRPYFRKPQAGRGGDGAPTPVGVSDLKHDQQKRDLWVKLRVEKYGKPYAPYNTTQFLMDDHNVRSPDYNEINKLMKTNHKEHTHHGLENNEPHEDGSDSDEFYSSPDDEQDFLQRQFSETYENIHAERLTTMSKTEIVQEYIALEQRVDDLEQRLKESRGLDRLRSLSDPLLPGASSSSEGSAAPSTSTSVLPLEEDKLSPNYVRRLIDENARLKLDNQRLRDAIGSRGTPTPAM